VSHMQDTRRLSEPVARAQRAIDRIDQVLARSRARKRVERRGDATRSIGVPIEYTRAGRILSIR